MLSEMVLIGNSIKRVVEIINLLDHMIQAQSAEGPVDWENHSVESSFNIYKDRDGFRFAWLEKTVSSTYTSKTFSVKVELDDDDNIVKTIYEETFKRTIG